MRSKCVLYHLLSRCPSTKLYSTLSTDYTVIFKGSMTFDCVGATMLAIQQKFESESSSVGCTNISSSSLAILAGRVTRPLQASGTHGHLRSERLRTGSSYWGEWFGHFVGVVSLWEWYKTNSPMTAIAVNVGYPNRVYKYVYIRYVHVFVLVTSWCRLLIPGPRGLNIINYNNICSNHGAA